MYDINIDRMDFFAPHTQPAKDKLNDSCVLEEVLDLGPTFISLEPILLICSLVSVANDPDWSELKVRSVFRGSTGFSRQAESH